MEYMFARGFDIKNLHRRCFFSLAFHFASGISLLLFFYAMFFVPNVCFANKLASSTIIDPSNIEFPESVEGQSIMNLGVALQRHKNGRIKTYFEAGRAWQVGTAALSFANDFTTGTYAAEGGIKITMLNDVGEKEFFVDAERACVLPNEKIGKCFGFVKLTKLTSPELEVYGTNLIWNTTSTNLFTIEKGVTLIIKNLDSKELEGK